MKIKEGYVRRNVAGTNIVVSVGEAAERFNGMIKLNETSNFLWERLEIGATKVELAESLINEYDVDMEKAVSDVDKFISDLSKINCIEE